MPRVLLVDDDRGSLETNGLCLRLEGIEVVTATTARDGVRAAFEASVDVALIDVHLPDASGFDVLRELRRHGYPGKVVLLTAFGTTDLAFEAGRERADEYLEGPMFAEELISCVRRCMSPSEEKDRGGAAEPNRDRARTPLWDPRVREALTVIHSGRHISAEELAVNVGLSVSRLRHLFRSSVGLPLHKYLLDRRLDLAARLLRETYEHVRQIGFAVGFQDVRYFRSVFQKRFGTTPARYRRGRSQPNRTNDEREC